MTAHSAFLKMAVTDGGGGAASSEAEKRDHGELPTYRGDNVNQQSANISALDINGEGPSVPGIIRLWPKSVSAYRPFLYCR